MMSKKQSFYTLLLLITSPVLFVMAGCSQGPKKPEDMPKLYPCTITVTQEGQPLEGANVRLIPTTQNYQWLIGERTDHNGVAVIHSHIYFKGAPEEVYKVLISKSEQTPSKYTGDPPEDPAERRKWNIAAEYEKRPNYELVNLDYGKEKTTPFEITVQKGKNAETFEVGSAIRIKVSE